MQSNNKPGPSQNIPGRARIDKNVEEFKYLGVILDSRLSFRKHVKKVVKTVNFNI